MKRALFVLALLAACAGDGETMRLGLRVPERASHDDVRRAYVVIDKRMRTLGVLAVDSRLRGQRLTLTVARPEHGLTREDVVDVLTTRGQFEVREIRPGFDPPRYEAPMVTSRDVAETRIEDGSIMVVLTKNAATSFAGDTHRLAQAMNSPGVAIFLDGVVITTTQVVQEVAGGTFQLPIELPRRRSYVLAATIAAGPLPVALAVR